MLIELPVWWVVGLNVMGWGAIQFGLAWGFTRLPDSWFHPRRMHGDHVWFYERVLRIRRWKDRLPDGASWLAGGFRKGSMGDRGPEYLRRFMRETWRGELCHWSAIAFVPVFALWNPPWAMAVIVGYALAANLPCIWVQRYNRRRMQRAVEGCAGCVRSRERQ